MGKFISYLIVYMLGAVTVYVAEHPSAQERIAKAWAWVVAKVRKPKP